MNDEIIRIKLKVAEKAKEQGIIICPIGEIAPREIPELLCNYQSLYEPITEDKTYQEYGWYRKFEKKRF